MQIQQTHSNATSAIGRLARRLLLSGGLAVTTGALAQTAGGLTIDNFATGATSITLNGAHQTGALSKSVFKNASGAIGKARNTYVAIQAPTENIFDQNSSLQIKAATSLAPAALVESNGFQIDSVTQIDYGAIASVPGGTTVPPLNLNLAPYDRVRVHFYSISTSDAINLNILLYTGTVFTQLACNISASPQTVTVDFPFVGAPGNANLGEIDSILVQFETYYGTTFGMTSIEFVPTGAAPGDVTCPPL